MIETICPTTFDINCNFSSIITIMIVSHISVKLILKLGIVMVVVELMKKIWKMEPPTNGRLIILRL